MVCQVCGRTVFALQRHHKFHNTEWARKLYGKYMNDPRNIQYACAHCNSSHGGLGLTHWTEEEFCEAVALEPRSKEAIFRRMQREKEENEQRRTAAVGSEEGRA